MNTTEFQDYFVGLDYPAHRDDLVRIAVGSGAPQSDVDQLRALPSRNFNGSIEVRTSLGIVEPRRDDVA